MNAAMLFEGIGGFGLAAERAGMNIAWHAENDAHASNVLAHHWPDTPNLGDVHDITGEPTVDVLTGGFPCQDYSVAGKGAGLAGDRGALWWQMHRIVAECRPTWVVGENVHGLTTRKHRDAFRTIIGSLVHLGYGVVWRVFDAQFFGVAQCRRRVFIVGHSGGQPRPEVLALAQGVSGDTPPRRGAGQGAATDVAPGVEAGGIPTTVGALRQRDWKGPPVDVEEPALIASGFDWTQNGAVPVEGLSPSLRVGSSIETLAAPPAVVSPAAQVRRLTPLECERLQGFPDGWTATPGNSDSQRYKQLGNAVAVPVVEWIMGQIAAAEGGQL